MKSSTLTTSAIAIAATWATPAFAQHVGGASPETISEIVVTGVRQIQREAISAKRDSDVIADFLAADDLAETVDLNIADALRRLPGVNTIFDEDEGRYVALRGLESNFTYFSYDGIQLASVDPSSRRVNTEMIPPTAVSRLEVLKTLSPELEGNAIGGHVNLVTRSAFDDRDGLSANLNAEFGKHSSDGVPGADDGLSPNLSAGLTTVFGTNDQFGLVLGGQYFDKIRDQRTFQNIGLFRAADGHIALDQPFLQDYTNTIERRSAIGKLEYRPSSRLYAFANVNWFDYQYDEVRYRNVLNGAGQPSGSGLLEGAYARASSEHRVNTFPLNLNVRTINGGFDYDVGESSKVTFDVGASRGENVEPSLQVRWSLPSSTLAAFAYSLRDGHDGVPRVTVADPDYVADLSNYELNRIVDSRFEMTEDVLTVKGDYAFNMETRDGVGVKFGGAHRTLEKDYANDLTIYLPEGDITGADFVGSTFVSPFAGVQVPISDWRATSAYFLNHQDAFESQRPDVDNLGQDYTLNEDVDSAFAMAKYRRGPVQVIGGVRYERTETKARFFNNNNATFQEAHTSGSYDDWLPSITGTRFIGDDKRIRASYSRALGRPDFGDLAGAASVSQYVYDENGQISSARVSLSNADLQPRRADNFDLALDWFIDEDRFFSAAVFHKNIDNYIFNATTATSDLSLLEGVQLLGELAPDGVLRVTRPRNAQVASINGVELQYYDEKLEFLPGFLKDFGVISNVTYVDGTVDLPTGAESDLYEQPGVQANLSLIYTRDRFEGRVTYAYRDDYINGLSDEVPAASTWEIAYEDINLDLRYDFTNHLVGKFKVRNLTNQDRYSVYGSAAPESGVVQEANAFGRSYWLGLSFKY